MKFSRLILLFFFSLFTSICVANTPIVDTSSYLAGDQKLEFRVFLDDRQIGTHVVNIRQDGEKINVNVDADFEVKFLFYTAFEYAHQTKEVWQNSCLQSIEATTNNNGEDLFISGQVQDGIFQMESHKGNQAIEGCIRNFSYWHKPLLESDHLLNAQTADYEPTMLEKIGREQLVINERPFTSDKFRLTAGDKEVIVWYTPDGRWIALRSQTGDGHTISYYTEDAF